MADTFQKDVQSLYELATACDSLTVFMPALGDMLSRNSAALVGITYAYRLIAIDTGFSCAFALNSGHYTPLNDNDRVDVTVSGKKSNLLAIFQRTLNPATAILLHKIRVDGSKSALLKLAALL